MKDNEKASSTCSRDLVTTEYEKKDKENYKENYKEKDKEKKENESHIKGKHTTSSRDLLQSMN